MDSYRKAQHLKYRLKIRSSLDKAKRYSLIAVTALTLAYLSDSCDASKKIDSGLSKIKEGIEYIIK